MRHLVRMPTKPPEPAKKPKTAKVSKVKAEPIVEVLPAPVSADVIEATVKEVNEVSRQATLELSLRMGKIIVDRFYGGDLGAWRERGTTDASFRELAAHPDIVPSPSGIYRAVAVYELTERLVGVSGLKQLGVGHFRAVLGLAEKHQQKLLVTASEKGWKIDKLEDEVAAIRKREGDGRGRKADPGFVKGIRRIEKLLDGDEHWFDDLDKVDQLGPKDAERLWKTVTGMKIKCEELQNRLSSRVPGFEPKE